MSSLAGKRFFVYALSMDQESKYVFYVGKGTKKRPYDHGPEALQGVLTLKCAVIRYLSKCSDGYWINIVHETDNEQEAYWHEMKAITQYPPGALCNVLTTYRPPAFRTEIDYVGHHWRGRLIDASTNKDIDIVAEHSPEGVETLLVIAYDRYVVPPYLRTIQYPHIDHMALRQLPR